MTWTTKKERKVKRKKVKEKVTNNFIKIYARRCMM